MKKLLLLQWLIFSFAFPWIAWLGHTSSNIIYTMSGLIIGVALVYIPLIIMEIKNQKTYQKEISEFFEKLEKSEKLSSDNEQKIKMLKNKLNT